MPAALASMAAAFFCAALVPAVARAQTTPRVDSPEQAAGAQTDEDSPVAHAREAFKLGTTLARQNQWKDALVAFERSADLHPHVVTTYNIGYVERALGRLTRAYKFLKQALDAGASGGEALPAELVTLAKSYLGEVESKLARVSVTTEQEGMAVSVDGRPLEPVAGPAADRPMLAAGTLAAGRPQPVPAKEFDLLIDPGPHVIVLSSPGRRDTTLTRTFELGAVTSLHLSPDADSPPPAKPDPSVSPVTSAPADQVEGTRTPAWVAFGVGAAGLVVGSVFGILALNQESELEANCSPKSTCPPNREEDIDRMNTYGTVADIGFGVGAAGLVTGAVLWLTGGPSDRQSGRALRVRGSVAPSSLSLSVFGDL